VNSYSLRVWDLRSGALKWEYRDSDYSPDVIAFSHDGNWLALGSNKLMEAGKVLLMDAATGQIIRCEYAKFDVYEDKMIAERAGVAQAEGGVGEVRQKRGDVACKVNDVTFSRDNGELCYGGGKTEAHEQQLNAVGLVGIFDKDSFMAVAPTFSAEVSAVASSSHRDCCALAFHQGPVLLASDFMSLASTKTSKELSGNRGGAWGLCFSPDGTLIAGAFGDGTVRVWDTDSCVLKATLVIQTDKNKLTQATAVAFSPDGSRLAAGNLDGDIFVWDMSHIKE
jgi:WD40 repeat protein